MLIAAVIKTHQGKHVKEHFYTTRGLLPAMTHGRDMLRMSAGTMGREPGKSSLFTPCATQQHRETRAKPQDCSLALLFMVQLQARMGCL